MFHTSQVNIFLLLTTCQFYITLLLNHHKNSRRWETEASALIINNFPQLYSLSVGPTAPGHLGLKSPQMLAFLRMVFYLLFLKIAGARDGANLITVSSATRDDTPPLTEFGAVY